MKHVRKPHQHDLFGSQPEAAEARALPMANQAEALLLLGKLLREIVQAETAAANGGSGDEQNHR
jgi:hypothetical protein